MLFQTDEVVRNNDEQVPEAAFGLTGLLDDGVVVLMLFLAAAATIRAVLLSTHAHAHVHGQDQVQQG